MVHSTAGEQGVGVGGPGVDEEAGVGELVGTTVKVEVGEGVAVGGRLATVGVGVAVGGTDAKFFSTMGRKMLNRAVISKS